MNIQFNSNTFFSNKADWAAFRAAWRQHARNRAATIEQHVVFTLLAGRSIEHAFSPVRNPVKLANGMRPYQAVDAVLHRLRCGWRLAEIWAPWSHLDDAPLKHLINELKGAQHAA